MIRINDLSFKVGKAVILDHLSVTLDEGGIYGIIGPNGAGKSTFLKHLMRLIETPKGKIILADRDICSYKVKEYARKCSYVFQENRRDVDFTVQEMLEMGRYPYLEQFGSIEADDQQIIQDVIEELGLSGLRTRSIKELSGGEAQKVFIGRALVQQTPLLLLDEPTSMLDIHNSIEILQLLKRVRAKYKLTIIIVMHDLNLAFQFCEKILLMKKGQLMMYDTAENVLESDLLKEVYHHKLHVIKENQIRYVVPINLKEGDEIL